MRMPIVVRPSLVAAALLVSQTAAAQKPAPRVASADSVAAGPVAGERLIQIGHVRLRVWDEGTRRYVPVRFAAEGYDDNPDGGTTVLAYSSGDGGWGEYAALEPGRWDLLVYEFTCNGEERMADEEFVRRAMPRITLFIEPGARVDKDIRLDVCAIEAYDLTDAPAPVTRRDVRSSR